MKKYSFGIDVGGTTVKCGLFTAEGELLEKWEIKTRLEDNGSNILSDIAATIKQKIVEKPLNMDDIAGVGIGIPGPVDENGEVPFAVNLHWGHTYIEKDLSEMIGLPVKAANDANVAALGELWKGGGSISQHDPRDARDGRRGRRHHQRQDRRGFARGGRRDRTRACGRFD